MDKQGVLTTAQLLVHRKHPVTLIKMKCYFFIFFKELSKSLLFHSDSVQVCEAGRSQGSHAHLSLSYLGVSYRGFQSLPYFCFSEASMPPVPPERGPSQEAGRVHRLALQRQADFSVSEGEPRRQESRGGSRSRARSVRFMLTLLYPHPLPLQPLPPPRYPAG